MSTGQSKLRRITASTRLAAVIDTSIDDEENRMKNKNSTIAPAGRPNASTVKEIIAMVDCQNVVETKLIIDSNIDCPTRSDGIVDKAILKNPISSSSTLETHL